MRTVENSFKSIRDMRLEGVPGYVGFSIKARDTDFNVETLDSFRAFCETYTRGDYTLGLSLLLAYYEERKTYGLLYDELEALKERVAALEAKGSSVEERVDKGELF